MALQYRPDIDGLRAVAVLAVLFYHAGLGFSGGYVGVDVFFVISGYLITSILMRSLSSEKFSYSVFWARRVQRLVPALVVVTAVVAVLGYLLLLPEDLADLGGALMAQPLLAVNIYYWRVLKTGYFGDPPEIRPLLHTWSLGVEEQFYIFWPIFLAGLFRLRALTQRRRILAIFVATLLSLACCVGLTPYKTVFSFFNLPCRAWELLLGGLLSCLPTHPRPPARWLTESVGVAGLGLIAYSVFLFTDATLFPGSAALVPCLGSAMLMWANSFANQSSAARLLSTRPFVLTGQISYSVYLWHWPLLSYACYIGFISPGSRVFLVALSLLLGYASWRWIETPFRLRTDSVRPTRALTIYTLYCVLCLPVGYLYRANQGFPDHWTGRSAALARVRHDLAFTEGVDFSKPLPAKLGDQSARPSFLLWGDSHAMSLAPVLDVLAKEHGASGYQLTRSSTPPILDWDGYAKAGGTPMTLEEQTKWSSMARQVAGDPEISTVFLVALWNGYASIPGFGDSLVETVKWLQGQGKTVIIVVDVPLQDFDSARALAVQARYPWLWSVPTYDRAAYDRSNEALRGWLTRMPGVQAYDPAPFLTNGDRVLNEVDGVALYRNQGHLSAGGALVLRPLFEPWFRSARSQ